MLALLLIFIRELTFVSSLALSREVDGFHISYLLLFYVLQIIAAPVQASISDFYSRKKGLAYGFLFVFIAHVFLFVALSKGTAFLLVSFIINGLFGNLTPIATASLLDVNFGKKSRISMGLVLGTSMVAYLSFYWARWYLNLEIIFWVMTTLCLLATFLSAFCFYDPRDADINETDFSLWKEIALIGEMIKKKWFFYSIKGYYLVYLIWYILYYYRIETLGPVDVIHAVTAFSLGYLGGVLAQMFVNNNDTEVISFGVMFSVFITLLFGIYILFGGKIFNTIVLLNFIFAFYYGVIDPRLYSYLSTHQHKHRLGTIFGLVESSDNLSELSSILIFTLLPKMNIVFLSFFSVVVLLIAYEVFNKSFKAHRKII